ncbi:MAG: hypothetical protein US42_C0005G0042 [Candidatus Magasanikbacteria bacterium GW2011_GWC2_37_14]|uniref:Methyltransferase domain-containing protein n=1 Tax=Candidatus Magasanikbacteria bacterium GW2011_GWC2_37_14 TaxID=1619046 RepID=A0A0G0GCW4_9BACT|nr:MAG: hypothetical protein US42_C0005G0042 [Candidatus Magasanikbacteria bacterium GW2011_GWC2_37_14]
MNFLFQLGHQPLISTAEIQAVFSSLKLKNIKTLKQNSNQYLLIETNKKLDSAKLIKQLGGTIKIATEIPPLIKGGEGGLLTHLQEYLITNCPTGKIEYSLNDQRLALELKKALKTNGYSVRYIEPKNTATILYNKLVEKKSDLTVINKQIFVTTALQPFEEMAERDYQRPDSDDLSGMLPPKLAKIMINLALSPFYQEGAGLPDMPSRQAGGVAEGAGVIKNKILLDPFCGSGTILNEATLMNFNNLIAADISEKAVVDSEKNFLWLKEKYNLKNIGCQFIISDATQLTKKIKNNSVTLIVTETYLGKPLTGRENKNQLEKQLTELKSLYLKACQEFYKILEPQGVIVIAIPKFKIGNDWLAINWEKDLKKIGFEIMPFRVETQNFASLLYHRPNQHLGREIYRFKKS